MNCSLKWGILIVLAFFGFLGSMVWASTFTHADKARDQQVIMECAKSHSLDECRKTLMYPGRVSP